MGERCSVFDGSEACDKFVETAVKSAAKIDHFETAKFGG
jgi:hypothetical protein